MNQSLLWGVFCCGFGLLAGFAPVSWSPEHPCVFAALWVPLGRRLSWMHRRAGSGCAGSRELHSAHTMEQGLCSHAALQSVNSHPGQHRWGMLPFIKGKKNNPENPPRSRKVWEAYGKSIAACNDKETSEKAGQGEVVRSNQQCGHRLGCQAGFS